MHPNKPKSTGEYLQAKKREEKEVEKQRKLQEKEKQKAERHSKHELASKLRLVTGKELSEKVVNDALLILLEQYSCIGGL